MQLRNSPSSYGAVARVLHWGIVLLIIAQYVMAEAADELADGPDKDALLGRHQSTGMLILLLAVVRIGWKLANRGLPQPVPASRPLQVGAAAGHGLLYLLLLALPLSGWLMSSAAGYPPSLYGWFDFPALLGTSDDLKETLEGVHEALFNTVVVVAVLHVLAALYHQFWLKDGALRRML